MGAAAGCCLSIDEELMPTYREGYADGFKDGQAAVGLGLSSPQPRHGKPTFPAKVMRKLSDWNKYVKANSKKPRFRYRNGKLKLKKMAIAYRKTPAGKKKRR